MKKDIARIEPKQPTMYLVVCGNSRIHKTGAHAALCFDLKVAEAEQKSMVDCEYPALGIFEITSLNIFHKIPHHLEGKIK
jgi:hypothetical protein